MARQRRQRKRREGGGQKSIGGQKQPHWWAKATAYWAAVSPKPPQIYSEIEYNTRRTYELVGKDSFLSDDCGPKLDCATKEQEWLK